MLATLIVIAVGVWLQLLFVVLAIGRATAGVLALRKGAEQWLAQQQAAQQQPPETP